MGDAFVSVVQAASGAVTATLYLDSLYVLTVPFGSNTVAVEFDYPLGVLCKATASLQAPMAPCPPAMRSVGFCVAAACQAAAPSRTDRYEVMAQFSVCPAARPNCRDFDSAVSAETLLLAGGAAPGGANVPSIPTTSTTVRGRATATTTSALASTTGSGQVALNPSGSNDSASASATSSTPIIVGVTVAVALAALGAVGFILVRRRAQSRMDDSLNTRFDQFNQPAAPPLDFENPLPPIPVIPASPQEQTSPTGPVVNSAFNSGKPLPLGALERKATANSEVTSVVEPRLVPEDEVAGTQAHVSAVPTYLPQGQQQQQQMTHVAPPFTRTRGYPQQYGQQVQPQYSQNSVMYAQYHPATAYAYPPTQPGFQNGQTQYPGYYDSYGNYHFFSQQPQPPPQQSPQSP
ncbi:hypothetical protein BDR26DRAFT_854044 [Obelidium mucronatum]|nr:hypothetical protein BDR26DRAFT_854044 [Obelidium mucronatum]